MFKLLILFTVVPLAELALLIKVGEYLGLDRTIALVLITGIVGASLAKYEGFRTLNKIKTELAAGRLPGKQMIDALLILVAGVLLVTPGVMTDVVGLSLLIPPVRALLRAYLSRRFQSQFVIHTNLTPHFENDEIVDIEAHVVEDEDDRPLP